MKRENCVFTSESVTEGHPDKLCDRISDSVLDAFVAQDPNSRVACECCAAPNTLMIMGEITSKAHVDVEKVAREAIKSVGYDKPARGFDDNCEIILRLNSQSADIAMGVDKSYEAKAGNADPCEIGAGDQGMMFGYASNETSELMPFAIAYAHKLTKRLAEVRKKNILDFLRPDGKAQLSVIYENGVPVGIDTVVVSAQHDESVDIEVLRAAIIEEVVKKVIPAEMLTSSTKYFINPTGRFVIGGPAGDSGLTGRKIIVDTYGGYAPHGGGAFSGKDSTKVDRSAAYMARYIAKNIVKNGIAEKCMLQLSYAIGVARPLNVFVDTEGSGKISDENIARAVMEKFDMRPAAIIERLGLRRPIFTPTSAYGHFGREEEGFSWENTNIELSL